MANTARYEAVELKRDRREAKAQGQDGDGDATASDELFHKLTWLRRQFAAIWKTAPRAVHLRYKHWEYNFLVGRGYRFRVPGISREELFADAARQAPEPKPTHALRFRHC